MRIDLARALFAALFMSWQAHAAQFVIVNADFPNEGFNDPTPAAPVGGNAGTTLEYGVADFSLALLADALGHDADAARFLKASLNYRNLLDPSTGWIRPRNADGSWYSPFDPAFDETGFQEGNSWQYSWLAPHDTTFYLRDLAGAFHSYYGAERFLVDDAELARARVALLVATRQVIRNALAVLGVSAPDRMDRDTNAQEPS